MAVCFTFGLLFIINTPSNFQEAVLKANARTKKWIAYSVVAGSLAVLLVSGIMVGLYLSGNLKREGGPLVSQPRVLNPIFRPLQNKDNPSNQANLSSINYDMFSEGVFTLEHLS